MVVSRCCSNDLCWLKERGDREGCPSTDVGVGKEGRPYQFVGIGVLQPSGKSAQAREAATSYLFDQGRGKT